MSYYEEEEQVVLRKKKPSAKEAKSTTVINQAMAAGNYEIHKKSTEPWLLLVSPHTSSDRLEFSPHHW